MGGRELSVRDGTKVEFDEDEHATGAKDTGEFAQKVGVIVDLRQREWTKGEGQRACDRGCGGEDKNKTARDLPLNAYCGHVRHHMNWKDMAGSGSQGYKART
jgi:hypothetical protein